MLKTDGPEIWLIESLTSMLKRFFIFVAFIFIHRGQCKHGRPLHLRKVFLHASRRGGGLVISCLQLGSEKIELSHHRVIISKRFLDLGAQRRIFLPQELHLFVQ